MILSILVFVILMILLVNLKIIKKLLLIKNLELLNSIEKVLTLFSSLIKYLINIFIEQTDVEKFATQIFADDIINMFRHQQDFNIPFQRFIPMYHHHFGYQCRVQLYGCLRLIDLLEELSHVVKVYKIKNLFYKKKIFSEF